MNYHTKISLSFKQLLKTISFIYFILFILISVHYVLDMTLNGILISDSITEKLFTHQALGLKKKK